MFQDEKVMPFKMFILQHLSKSKHKAAGFLRPSSLSLSLFRERKPVFNVIECGRVNSIFVFVISLSLSLILFSFLLTLPLLPLAVVIAVERSSFAILFYLLSMIFVSLCLPTKFVSKMSGVAMNIEHIVGVGCYIFISFSPSLFVRSLYFNEHVLSLS